MSRHMILAERAIASALALLAIHGAQAQSLASRVAAAPAGEVRMIYATRTGVCGDSHDVVALGAAVNVYNSVESYGRWSGVRCEPGAARVAVRKDATGVATVRTRIGGTWESAATPVTDLGTVSAPAAASYFLDLAERNDGRAARNAMLAAVVADSVDINPRLLQIGQNRRDPSDVRSTAIHWLGILGDPSYVAPLTALARGSDGDDDVGKAATFALSQLPNQVGIPSLIALARSAPRDEVRQDAVFWLGQSDNVQARAEVRAIAADTSQPDEVRGRAAFALGQGDNTSPEDYRFLRELFSKVRAENIQNSILLVMSQSDDQANHRWLLDIARDENTPIEGRKKALFWAGQGGSPTSDIVALYDAARNEELKEHAIFVLSQRNDKPARDKLVAIARSGDDTELRKKALFWLAQKHDPEATRLISDMITKP